MFGVSVPFEVLNYPIPVYLCSENSFSRTCNIPSLNTFYRLHRRALLTLETLHWFGVCMFANCMGTKRIVGSV